jgi:hypothetical protein
MAMNTWLQMVSKEEIENLKVNPDLINKLNKKNRESYSTDYRSCINYFLTGDAYPDSADHVLGGLLDGTLSIETEVLENGDFGLVEPTEVKNILLELTKVDLTEVKKKVQDADPDELEEQEVDDWEILTDDNENPEKVLLSDIKRLVKFYKNAEQNGLGIVMYTS